MSALACKVMYALCYLHVEIRKKPQLLVDLEPQLPQQRTSEGLRQLWYMICNDPMIRWHKNTLWTVLWGLSLILFSFLLQVWCQSGSLLVPSSFAAWLPPTSATSRPPASALSGSPRRPALAASTSCKSRLSVSTCKREPFKKQDKTEILQI